MIALPCALLPQALKTYVPGAVHKTCAAGTAWTGTRTLECAASHASHSGHHEPERIGVRAIQDSGE